MLLYDAQGVLVDQTRYSAFDPWESLISAHSLARKSPTKTARKSSAKKARAAGRSAVKRERLRRSARSTGYKKGAYSQSQLERQAWRGTGTRKDPIQL